MKQDKNIETLDAEDIRLLEAFAQMSHEIDKHNTATSSEFTHSVIETLPRRDISLWVVSVATILGMAMVCITMGYDGVMAFTHQVLDFFDTLSSFTIPSMASVVSVAGGTIILYVICKALLYTEDYVNEM